MARDKTILNHILSCVFSVCGQTKQASGSLYLVIITYVHCLISAREALREWLPDQLRDATFAASLEEDEITNRYLDELLRNLDSKSHIF